MEKKIKKNHTQKGRKEQSLIPNKYKSASPSEINLSKEELEKLFIGCNQEHITLIKFLYDNYREILREYENKFHKNLRVEFCCNRKK